jgi:hypothetical protein
MLTLPDDILFDVLAFLGCEAYEDAMLFILRDCANGSENNEPGRDKLVAYANAFMCDADNCMIYCNKVWPNGKSTHYFRNRLEHRQASTNTTTNAFGLSKCADKCTKQLHDALDNGHLHRFIDTGKPAMSRFWKHHDTGKEQRIHRNQLMLQDYNDMRAEDMKRMFVYLNLRYGLSVQYIRRLIRRERKDEEKRMLKT